MGQHQSVITNYSDDGLPPLYYYGPDRKTIMMRIKKNDEKVVGILEEEECVSERMRCSNSAGSFEQSPSMIPEVSVAPSSPLTPGTDSSHFVPSSSFPDSLPLADVSFSPSPSKPRKLVAAPFNDVSRRRTFLQLPEKEDSVVPAKKPKEVKDSVKAKTQEAVYDSTPTRVLPEKNCQWKTPEPIATSTPIQATAPKSRIRIARAPSDPSVVAPTLAAKVVEQVELPGPNIDKAPPVVQQSTASTAPPPRTTSLQKSAAERGFPPRRLPLPNFPQMNPVHMNQIHMMHMMNIMQHQMRMHMEMQMKQQQQHTMDQQQQQEMHPQQRAMHTQQQEMHPQQQAMHPQQQALPQQTMHQPQNKMTEQPNAVNQPAQMLNPQQMIHLQQMMFLQQQMMMRQQQQQMAPQPRVVPQQQGLQPMEKVVQTEVSAQVTSSRPLSSNKARALFTSLADPGPLRSPQPKARISKRPAYPQMGLTPRKVKQRRSAQLGLGVTEKMYGSIDGPVRKPSPLPILTNPNDVSRIYANSAGLMSPMRPHTPMSPIPKLTPLPPLFLPKASVGCLGVATIVSPIKGVRPPPGFPQAMPLPPLPSYAQIFPRGEVKQNLSPPPGQFQNNGTYGQFV